MCGRALKQSPVPWNEVFQRVSFFDQFRNYIQVGAPFSCLCWHVLRLASAGLAAAVPASQLL